MLVPQRPRRGAARAPGTASPPVPSRGGIALAEVLVALALSAVVAASAALALVAAERYVRGTRWRQDDAHAVRDAALVLRSALRDAAPDSLRILGDTAVEFLSLVGSSVACVVGANAVVVPPSAPVGGDTLSAWRATPEMGDALVGWDSTSAGHWRLAVVDSVETRTDGGGCSPAAGFMSVADSIARTPVLRLHLDRALGAGFTPGAPLRVERRARFVLVRGSDRQWTLSYRRCSLDGVCGSSQPVAGPLAAATDSGLVVAMSASLPRLRIAVRGARHSGLDAREALDLLLSLRNAGGTPP